MIEPYFSIIIPTLNEQDSIGGLLNDIDGQIFRDFEVIVVDGNSSDDTVEIAKKFTIKVIETKIRGVANQRNLGAEKAQGKYILFMDADNYLRSDFLKKLKDQIKKYKPDVFTCDIETERNTFKEKIMATVINLYIHGLFLFYTPVAIGACVGCLRTVININNDFLFDQLLVPFEDGAFVKKLYRSGCHCLLFAEPKFGFSLRRFQKNGFLITSVHYVNMLLTTKLLRKKLELNIDYRMGGKEPTKLEY